MDPFRHPFENIFDHCSVSFFFFIVDAFVYALRPKTASHNNVPKLWFAVIWRTFLNKRSHPRKYTMFGSIWGFLRSCFLNFGRVSINLDVNFGTVRWYAVSVASKTRSLRSGFADFPCRTPRIQLMKNWRPFVNPKLQKSIQKQSQIHPKFETNMKRKVTWEIPGKS